MNQTRMRALGVGPIRTFEAVARHLSFSAAAAELHLTQSAVSRQIRSLEDELAAPLFLRGTRHVELTGAGQLLLRAVAPLLDRLDTTVRQIRIARGRRHVSVTTFASFASLWLLPRLHSFQSAHPDIDIRVSASDALVDLDDPELDVALRYCGPENAPPGAIRMFGETLTPVISPRLGEQAAAGHAPPLRVPADLAQHALLEEDSTLPNAELLSWRHWLEQQGQPQIEPRRWIYLNFTYQQVQAALAGQGVALARLALVHEALLRGELIEPFGAAGRIANPYGYWLVPLPEARNRAELREFIAWIEEQAAATRAAVAEKAGTA
jgi:LysR family glycine cleavage system transcriptional activator